MSTRGSITDITGPGPSGLPRYGRALFAALQLTQPDFRDLQALRKDEWQELLNLCDKTQVTLLLRYLARPFLPTWVRERVDRNYADNTLRFERVKLAVIEIAQCFNDRSIAFTLLKGFTHAPAFVPDPCLRTQGDLDLWCTAQTVFQARDALVALGYRPFATTKGRHLDPMIREAAWVWEGDYFAPDLPIPVDLHYELWDRKLERLAGPDLEGLWQRRCLTSVSGHNVWTLDLADTVAFAALHSMMHILHGDLRPQRAWEIAAFLNQRCEDDGFWQEWQRRYPDALRRNQVVAFLLSHALFGGRLPRIIHMETALLPESTLFWLKHFRFSPFESLFAPNKQELWLHLSLLDRVGDKVHVSLRRLLPLRAAVSNNKKTGTRCSIKPSHAIERAGHLLRRCHHHLVLLPRMALFGFHWWWARRPHERPLFATCRRIRRLRLR